MFRPISNTHDHLSLTLRLWHFKRYYLMHITVSQKYNTDYFRFFPGFSVALYGKIIKNTSATLALLDPSQGHLSSILGTQIFPVFASSSPVGMEEKSISFWKKQPLVRLKAMSSACTSVPWSHSSDYVPFHGHSLGKIALFQREALGLFNFDSKFCSNSTNPMLALLVPPFQRNIARFCATGQRRESARKTAPGGWHEPWQDQWLGHVIPSLGGTILPYLRVARWCQLDWIGNWSAHSNSSLTKWVQTGHSRYSRPLLKSKDVVSCSFWKPSFAYSFACNPITTCLSSRQFSRPHRVRVRPTFSHLGLSCRCPTCCPGHSGYWEALEGQLGGTTQV